MNVRTFAPRRQNSKPSAPATQSTESAQVRHLHRERDFGVGYGNSSGYANYRRYSNSGFEPLFRCA